MDLVTADDFRGSSHSIAMARSVLALSIIQDGAEPDRNGPRRLEVVKTNLCRYPKALGVWFEDSHELDEGQCSHELEIPDCSGTGLGEGGDCGGIGGGPSVSSGSHSVPVVRYGDAPEAYREPAQAEACAAWLVEVLEEAGVPVRPWDVVALGKEVRV